MRFPRQAKIFRGQLDAAPMLAVLFLLLIFLELCSLVYTPGVSIQIPTAQSPADSAARWNLAGTPNPIIVVAVSPNQIFYDNRIVEESELRTELKDRLRAEKSEGKDLTLVLRIDKHVDFDAQARLYQLAGDVGIKDIVLALQPPASARPAAKPTP